MIKNILKISLSIFFVFTTTLIFGQFGNNPKKLDKKISEKYFQTGNIKFDDGVERQCNMFFDWSTGILYERQGEVTLPHTSFKVISFEYIDKNNYNINRKFYSLPYSLPEAKVKDQLMFFEVLYEEKNLAVLKLHYEEYLGVRSYNKTSDPSFYSPDNGRVQAVYDRILLVNGNSGFMCLLESEGKLSGFWQDDRTYDKLHLEVLEEIFNEEYDQLMEYIESNKLKVKRVDDLISAIKNYKK